MERCPCCKARLRDATLCSRCQTDISLAAGAEQAARHWFDTAIRHWRNGETERCLIALQRAHNLKHSRLAMTLFDCLLERQCHDILQQLAQQQNLAAKQRIYPLRRLFPEHKLLRQINDFIDYRLAMAG